MMIYSFTMWLCTVHQHLYNVSFVYDVRKIGLKVIKILDIMQNVVFNEITQSGALISLIPYKTE
jgi:hypothetical protein